MLYAEIRHDVCCFFGSNCWESSGIHWEGSFFLFCWGNILRDRFFSSTTCHDTKSLTIWFVWTLISCQALEFGLIDGVLETEYWMAMGKKMDMNSTPKAQTCMWNSSFQPSKLRMSNICVCFFASKCIYLIIQNLEMLSDVMICILTILLGPCLDNVIFLSIYFTNSWVNEKSSGSTV